MSTYRIIRKKKIDATSQAGQDNTYKSTVLVEKKQYGTDCVHRAITLEEQYTMVDWDSESDEMEGPKRKTAKPPADSRRGV